MSDRRTHVLNLPRGTVDFETASELDVKDVGAWRYAEHHSTFILCMSYRLPGQELKTWVPERDGRFPQEVIDHIEAGYLLEAHNAQFEQAIWYWKLYRTGLCKMATRWADTMAVCGYRSVPLKLEEVGSVTGLKAQKDKRGKELLQKLSKPRKPKKADKELFTVLYGDDPKNWPVIWMKNEPEGQQLLPELYEYCEQDVRTEESLSETLGGLPTREYAIWHMDQKINNRGLRLDLNAVVSARRVLEHVQKELREELKHITDGQIQSGDQRDRILAWCAEQETPLPDMKADTVKNFLNKDWIPDNVRRVLQIRQQLGKASTAKLDRMYQCACADGRVRGLLQYHGAGTGRWAGRLVQPQNLPRDVPENVEEIVQTIKTLPPADAADALRMLHGEPIEVLANCLRGMFIADEGKVLRVADFSAIEAVVLAWIAGEEWKLEAFDHINHGGTYQGAGDIYCVAASMVFGYPVKSKKTHPVERQVGKVAELALGYQGGVGAWKSFDDSGRYSDAEIDYYKNQWRDNHPNIVRLWYGIEEAAIYCVSTGKSTHYRNIGFRLYEDSVGLWLVIVLPNGKPLWYLRPQVHKVEKFGEMRPELSFEGRDNKRQGAWGRVSTYGGKLVENIVQAVSRELMAEAMLREEKAGYPIVLTVHDEVVAEVDEGYGSQEEFEHVMARPIPKWAKGCPIAVDGGAVYRYQKV